MSITTILELVAAINVASNGATLDLTGWISGQSLPANTIIGDLGKRIILTNLPATPFLSNINATNILQNLVFVQPTRTLVTTLNGGIIRNVAIINSTALPVTPLNDQAALVRTMSSGHISGCVNLRNITNTSNCAGLVYSMTGGEIRDCVNRGTINANSTAVASGIVYSMSNNSICTNCQNLGTINATASLAAGIVYQISENCECLNCDNYGTINASYAVGIVRAMTGDSSCINCHNSGMINAQYASGIVNQMSVNSNCSLCNNYGPINGIYGVGIVLLMQNDSTCSNCDNYGVITATGGIAVGIVVDMSGNSTCSHCNNHAPMTGDTVSGLCFIIRDRTVSARAALSCCANMGQLTTTRDVAGLVYAIDSDEPCNIVRCSNSGTMRVTGSSSVASGLLGAFATIKDAVCTFTDCYNRGSFSSQTDTQIFPFSGISNADFVNCYSTSQGVTPEFVTGNTFDNCFLLYTGSTLIPSGITRVNTVAAIGDTTWDFLNTWIRLDGLPPLLKCAPLVTLRDETSNLYIDLDMTSPLALCINRSYQLNVVFPETPLTSEVTYTLNEVELMNNILLSDTATTSSITLAVLIDGELYTSRQITFVDAGTLTITPTNSLNPVLLLTNNTYVLSTSGTPGGVFSSNLAGVSFQGNAQSRTLTFTTGTSGPVTFTYTVGGCQAQLMAFVGTITVPTSPLCPNRDYTLSTDLPADTYSITVTSNSTDITINPDTGTFSGTSGATGSVLISVNDVEMTTLSVTFQTDVPLSGLPPTLFVGRTYTLSVPLGTTGTFSSSDPLHATIDATTGVICTLRPGSVTFTFTTQNGCEVSITRNIIIMTVRKSVPGKSSKASRRKNRPMCPEHGPSFWSSPEFCID